MKPIILSRRSFLQTLGAGILIAATGSITSAQEEPTPRRGGRRGGGADNSNIAARLHIGKDGSITVMTGKVEGGQGLAERSRRRRLRSFALLQIAFN